MLPLDKANSALAANVGALLDAMSHRPPRPELAARIGIGDKTLGFLKAGSGNPTLESIATFASYFRKDAWELLKPVQSSEEALSKLTELATPRSRAALNAIQKAAETGALTDDDLILLQRIAERFLGN